MPSETIPTRREIAYLLKRRVTHLNRSKIIEEPFGTMTEDSFPNLNCPSEYRWEGQEEPKGVYQGTNRPSHPMSHNPLEVIS
jgi:hypothetical protein